MLSAVLWIVAACLLLFSVTRCLAYRAIPVLPRGGRTEAEAGADLPRVSVIVAARDEAARIGNTVRRILDQRGVDLELIVADDRSKDATPAILTELARVEPRLRVVRIDDLPDGWMGKPHACHRAAEHAVGQWLLFTDGDVWMEPDLLARAVRAARQEQAEHLCLYPREGRPTLPARATQLLLAVSFATLSARVNRDRRHSFVGVGAFNLVRADAYRAIGGHRRLQHEVVDDVKLGLLLARAGFRSRIFDAAQDLEVLWAPTLGGLLRAVEKNLFALLDFRLTLAVLATAVPAAVWLAALVGPLLGTPAGIGAGLGLASVWVPARIAARRFGYGWVETLLAPLMLPAALAAVAHSVATTLRLGGIRWRGTFYPLGDLRKGLVPWLGPGRPRAPL